jgi:hypothetical protein
MTECAITAVWCFTLFYTVLEPDGLRTKQEWIGFETEAPCQELKERYQGMIGKALYARHRTAYINHADCTQMGRIK